MIWLPDDRRAAEHQVILAIRRGSGLFVIVETPAAEQPPAPLTRVAVTADDAPLQWVNANGHSSRASRLLLTTMFEAPAADPDTLRVDVNVNGETARTETLSRHEI